MKPSKSKTQFRKKYSSLLRPGGEAEARRVCAMLANNLKHGCESESEFQSQLKSLEALASASLLHLTLLASSQGFSTMSMERRKQVVARLLGVVIEAVHSIDARSKEESFFQIKAGTVVAGEVPLILVHAQTLDRWPTLLNGKKEQAEKRAKFLRERLKLGYFFRRKLDRAVHSFESRVAARLLDCIYTDRYCNRPGSMAEARDLKTPISAHKQDWNRVIDLYLNKWYGEEIGSHPDFAHWLDGRGYRDGNQAKRQYSLGQVGTLSTHIRKCIRESFHCQASRLYSW